MRSGAAVLLVLALLAVLLAVLVVHSGGPSRPPTWEGQARGGGRPAPLLGLRFDTGELPWGARVSLAAASSAPSVRLAGAEPGALYTVVMYDPDAPRKEAPTAAPVRHWVATDVRATAAGDLATAGTPGDPYMGPNPPPGSGPHRYVVAAYEQAGPIAATFPASRLRWELQSFLQGHRLRLAAEAMFVAERPAP